MFLKNEYITTSVNNQGTYVSIWSRLLIREWVEREATEAIESAIGESRTCQLHSGDHWFRVHIRCGTTDGFNNALNKLMYAEIISEPHIFFCRNDLFHSVFKMIKMMFSDLLISR